MKRILLLLLKNLKVPQQLLQNFVNISCNYIGKQAILKGCRVKLILINYQAIIGLTMLIIFYLLNSYHIQKH
jgi:hypothetical protein